MLGRAVADPDGIEGAPGETPGLGLLDVETRMGGDKHLTQVRAQHVASGEAFSGYEIHIGQTDGPDRARPFAQVLGRAEGAVSGDGRVAGSYLHGMFAEDGFRRAWLSGFGAEVSDIGYNAGVETTLDALADHIETHLDVAGLFGVAR